MKWWQRLLGKRWGLPQEAQASSASEPAPWLGADDKGNPFGVPILNLMGNLQLISTTSEQTNAERAISWRPGQHERLRWDLAGESFACDLEYAIEEPLPDGMLFIPREMEDKWVVAWKNGKIAAARSWTGETQLLAEASQSGSCLRVTRLVLAPSAGLSTLGDPVDVFHWMMETHVLEQRVPLPASAEGAAMLERTPLMGMSLFGHRLFCAAKDYRLPFSGRPVRSDGELVAAIDDGDLARVRRLLDAGQGATTPSRRSGYRPLHLAVAAKQAALVRFLLERGVDPNQAADELRRPLPLAVVVGAEEAVLQMLVDAGADLEVPDIKQFRPLHAAAEADNVAAIRFLWARGVEHEPRTVDGFTPLHIACALGHLDAAKELVRLGADPKAASKVGVALDIARQEGKKDVVRWLERL